MSDTQSQNVTNLPAKESFKPLRECTTLGEAFETREFQHRMASAIPKHMNPDTMLAAFKQAVGRTPAIMQCNLRQSLGAFMSLTQLGLVPGTVLGHAHLIPFRFTQRWNPKTRQKEDGYDLQVIIGYAGLAELAMRSGKVLDLQTGVVLLGEHFRHRKGTEKFIEHEQNIDADPTKTQPRCAYAVATLENNGSEFEIMSWAEIMQIRDRSQAYRRAVAALEKSQGDSKRVPLTYSEAPWVRDEREMARKTVLRRLAKILPKCPELRAAVAIEDANEAGRRQNFAPIIDGTAHAIDGIPEADEHEEDPGASSVGAPSDPSSRPDASFTDRRDEAEKPRQTRKRREAPQEEAPRQEAEAPKPNPTPAPAPRPAFEGYLIDQFGEIAGQFTDPVEFASSLVALWNETEGNENLREHNADAIEEARKNPAAAALLKELDEPPEENQVEETVVPLTYSPVSPPMNGGRAAWSVYPHMLKDDLASVAPADLSTWLAAQRGTLATAPISPKLLAVKAITEAFTNAGHTIPGWLTEGLPKQQEGSKPGDARWAEDITAALSGLTVDHQGRRELDQLMNNTITQTVMARLSREDRPLFERMDKLFKEKHDLLPRDVGSRP